MRKNKNQRRCQDHSALARSRRRAHLFFEPLEDRRLLAGIPQSTLDVPAEEFVGESFNFNVTFDNVATNSADVGYGPFVDLIIPVNGADGNAGMDTPDGVNFLNATYLGQPVTTTILTFPDDGGGVGTVEHPYAVDVNGDPLPVTGDTGDQLVVLQLPFGSFAPDQPAAVIEVNAGLSNLADVGTPLDIRTRAGFQFGCDPLNNPATDPTVFSPGDNSQFSDLWTTTDDVTPILMKIDKEYLGPESETTTGPNFPRQYRIVLDIADGQTITDLDIIDQLDNNMAFLSLDSTTSAAGGTTFTTPMGLPPVGMPANNNELIVNADTVTGTLGDNDVEVVFSFYVTEFDADGNRVIPIEGTPFGQTTDMATAQGDWDPIDPRDPSTPDNATAGPATHVLTDKSIAIQKYVMPLGPVVPGGVLEYRLEFQVSDYYTFGDLRVEDILGDGQDYLASFAPTFDITDRGGNFMGTFTLGGDLMRTVNVDGTETLDFDVSAALMGAGDDGILQGGLSTAPDGDDSNPAAGAVGTIIFRSEITDTYDVPPASGNTQVSQGDTISNDVNVGGTVRDNDDPSMVIDMTPVTDDSSSEVEIETGTTSKSIFAINGTPVGAGTPSVSPGDLVTYSLEYSTSLTSFLDLTLDDYLPLPIYQVDDADGDGAPGPAWSFVDDGNPNNVPAVGVVEYGPNDTFSALATGSMGPDFFLPPQITEDAANNRLSFFYGDFNDPLNQASTIQLLFTVAVTSEPFADGLFLTNQLRGSENNSELEPSIGDSTDQVQVAEPELNITKGVVATDGPNGVFTPTPGVAAPLSISPPGTAGYRFSGGTINSDYLEVSPTVRNLDSDLSGIDAGDLVTYSIVVENTGSSRRGAFEVGIRDALPPEMRVPTLAESAAGLNLSVTDGTGAPIAFTTVGGGLFDPVGGILLTDPGPTPELADGTDGGALDEFDATDGRNVVIVTYDLITDVAIQPRELTTNTASIYQFAGSPGGPNFVPNVLEPNSPLADDAVVQATDPVVSKTIVDTNQAHTTGTDVTIGEIVTYQVEITVPEGTTENVTWVDRLDPGLAFVGINSITPSSADVTTTYPGGFAGVGTDVVVSNVGSGDENLGREITLDFDNVINANTNNAVPETIVVEYDVVVLNSTTSNRNDRKNNRVDWRWETTEGPQQVRTQAPNVTVVEPRLRVLKTANPVIVEAGDVVTYTLRLRHVRSSADTFNVELGDTIPPDLTFVPGSLTVTGTAPTSIMEAGGVITASWDSYPQTATTTIQYQATVEPTAVAGDVLPNAVAVRHTSLPGDVTTPQSIHNPLSTERTGDTGDPGGRVNDYLTLNLAAVIIRRPAVVEKTLVSTSEPHTDLANVAIGEVARFQLEVELFAGTTVNLNVVDRLPPGLQLIDPEEVRISFISDAPLLTDPDLAGANGGGDPPTFMMPANRITGTQDVVFDFGTIVNQDNDANSERILIEFNALVTNTTDTNDGDVKTNTFDLLIDGNLISTSPGVDLTIQEPRIDDLTKQLDSPLPLDAGDLALYRLSFSNTGTTTAFDVQLTDVLDPVALVLDPTQTLVASTAGVTDVVDNSMGNTLDISIGSIPAGESVIVFYSATTTAAVQPGQTIPNTVDLTYTSLPDAGTPETDPGNPTGSQTPGASGAANGERDGSGGVNDYRDMANASFDIIDPQFNKTITATNQSHTAGLDVAIGEIVTYEAVVTIPEGTSPTTVITDTPDPGLAIVAIDNIVPSTTQLTTDVAGGYPAIVVAANNNLPTDGSSFTADFGTLTNLDRDNATPETITITYRAVVLNSLANQDGVPLENDADFTWSQGTVTAQAQPVTIVEPDLEITKSNGNPLVGDAGDTITFTLTVEHTANSSADAFDVNLSDLIDSVANDLDYVPGTVNVVNNNGAVLAGPPDDTGGDLSIDWSLFPQGASATITFDVILLVTVNPETILVNQADLTWTGLPGDFTTPQSSNPISVERTGDPTGPGEPGANDYRDTDLGFIGTPSLLFDKFVFDTSLPSTDDSQFDPNLTDLTIGETVTYLIGADFTDGTTNNVVITDVLPNLGTTNGTLEFVSASLAHVGSDLTNGMGGAITLPAPTTSDSNADGVLDTYAYNFGTIINAPGPGMTPALQDQLGILITARVLDTLPNMTPVNFSGDVLTNTATLTATGGLGQPIMRAATADVEIVEPLLDIQKDVTPTQVDGGDTVTFTITVDHLPTSTADAYDVAITDALPAGLTYAGNLVVLSGPGPSVNVMGQNLTFAWPAITLDDADLPYQFTFDATVDYTIQPGDTFINTANLGWSTLPGPDPNERTYTDTDPAEVVTGTVTATDPVKTLISTSEAHTTGADVVVGEIVRYRLQFNVSEGTLPNLALVDTLDPGLAFLDPTQVFISFTSDVAMGSDADLAGANNAAVPPTFLLDASRIAINGQEVRFNLGNIVNNDNDADDEFITLEYNVLVDNTVNTNDGDVLNNLFEVDLNGTTIGPTNPGDNTTSVTVREPSITDVAKTVIDFDGTSDTYQVVYSNTGSTTAYDVQMLDVLPAELTLDLTSISTVLLNGAAGLDITNSMGNTVDIRVDEIPVGGQVITTYRATLNATGQTITNTANVTYTSLPGPNGTTTNPTGSQTPGASGDVNGERNGQGAVNDYTDSSQQQLGSIGDFVWSDLNGDGGQGVIEPGIDGVVVNLTWAGVNGIFGDGDDVRLTTTTAGGGLYNFSGLPPGEYQVEVDTTTVPAGLLNTFDRDSDLDSQAPTTLAPGENQTDLDFGYAQPAQISGLKFNDVNGNGVQDAGEGPIAGVTIWIDLNDDGVLGPGEPSAVTAADGTFTIDNLLPGTYTVREIPPLGYVQTFPAGGAPQIVTVNPGDMLVDVNFGNFQEPPNILDCGDPEVTLIGDGWEIYDPCDGHFGGNACASRPGAGENQAIYTFTGLTPGTYRVSATWVPTGRSATNAPYTLTGGTPETVLINQQLSPASYPNSFVDSGATWADLDAMYTITGTTLTVTLTNDANNWVTADAIRVARIMTPEISVSEGGTDLVSGASTVDFGSTSQGVPVVRTFTVENQGSDDLLLADAVVLPTGYSVSAPFGMTTLMPGEMTTVSVQLDAANSGTFAGDLEIYSSDIDENPFQIPITGTVDALIIDNGDANYSNNGGWTDFTSAGFQGDGAYSFMGSGGSVATWTFTGLTPGTTYDVAATWAEGANRATNAPFTLTGGAAPSTVQVNQQVAPDDFTTSGVAWENLGQVTVAGTTLTVQLSDDANGFVIADAVQVSMVGSSAAGADVAVEADGADVPDGTGVVDFGTAVLGIPVVKTVTVTNRGTQPLTLTEPISAPAGYLVSNFGATTLNPNDSTTFTLTLTSTIAGSPSGTVSFGTNDADENPFDFTVTAQIDSSFTPVVVDNSESSFSTVGGWVPYNGIGVQNNVVYSAPGTGSNVATWSATVPTPGIYRVAVTWVEHPNRATNAPYAIDGGTPILVNQQVAPNDFTDNGVAWEDLGNFVVTGTTLTVTLSNAANGYVIGDAIRFDRIASPEITVDLDGDLITDGSGVVDLGELPAGVDQEWEFRIRNIGTEPLILGGPISVPGGFTASSFGRSILPAEESTTFTLSYIPSGTGEFGGTISFDTNDGDEPEFDFTIVGEVAGAPKPQIVDNDNAGASLVGSWPYYGAGHAGDLRYSAPGNGSNVASWEFELSVPGTYRVSTTWLPHPNRATDAPYTIIGGASPVTVDVNQELAPNDFNDAGSAWEDLGTFAIVGNTLTVQLSNDANQYIIADAVRIEYVSPLLAADGQGDGIGDVSFTDARFTESLLADAVRIAANRWRMAGLTAEQSARLESVSAKVTDLPGNMLGGATSVGLLIDATAAGHGWYTGGATGHDALDWIGNGSSQQIALSGTAAASRIDLLTVVEHELGHLLGGVDLSPTLHPFDLMSANLPTGTRRTAIASNGLGALAGIFGTPSPFTGASDSIVNPLWLGDVASAWDDAPSQEEHDRTNQKVPLTDSDALQRDLIRRLPSSNATAEAPFADQDDDESWERLLEELAGSRPANHEVRDALFAEEK